MQLLWVAVLGVIVWVGLWAAKRGRPATAAVRRGKRTRRRKRKDGDSDLFLALRGQGYSKGEARRRARRARGSTFEELFKSALQ